MTSKTYDLSQLTKQDMQERGLEPDFSKEVLQQLDTIQKPVSKLASCGAYT